MTSKLLKTIVGVGIALGAAPACLGRTGTAELEPSRDGADTTEPAPTRSPSPDPAPSDAGPDAPKAPNPNPNPDPNPNPNPPDASVPPDSGATPDSGIAPDPTTDAGTDADAPDASTDAGVDPFCDVSWPPTKANPGPGRVACVDPLHDCADAWPPYRCYKLVAPFTCTGELQFEGPLYCIDGAWRCPPGASEGERCKCWGPLEPGQTCTEDGTIVTDGGTGGEGGGG